MITYVKGDLFESPAHVLVNTVNTVGVMGKGIAKQFKKLYPEMFKQYQKLCEDNILTTGKLWLYKTSNKWILNFPTKTTWRKPSKLEYIENGLYSFSKNYSKMGITSIAFPPLGCGNGELDWESEVHPVMEKYLKNIPIDIFIYLYWQNDFVPEHKNIKEMKKWLLSEPESFSFIEVWEDLKDSIGNEIELKSLFKKNKFKAKIVDSDPEKRIDIFFNNKNFSVYYEDLYELWNQIKNYGFSLKKIMPSSLEHVDEQILKIFSLLPYCKVVNITMDYNKKDNLGLQFFPKTQNLKSSQLSILL